MTPERAWHIVRLRLRSIFHARAVDGELDEELRYHVERLVEVNLANGLPPEEARRLALVAMDGLEVQEEACRDRRGVRLIDDVVRDLQYAWRISLKDRGTTIVAVLSLALAIGANTAIFSIVDSLLLRALPVQAPRQLALLSDGTNSQFGSQWSYAVWQQLQMRPSMFDGEVAWSMPRFDLADRGEINPVNGLYASGDFFAVLGIHPVLGRVFTRDDDRRGGGVAGPVAVISYAFWQRRFGGAADVVGSLLVVDHVPLTIVGVTPPEFFGPEVGRAFDVAVPIGVEPLIDGKDALVDKRMNMWLRVMFRLKDGQSIDAATTAIRGLQPAIREAAMFSGLPQLRKTYLVEPFSLTPAATGESLLRRRYERPLLAVFGIVVLVLLIACANIANLFLARASSRRRELSVRLALGAPRGRIVRQFLVESLCLAGVGATAGFALANWGTRALVAGLTTAVDRVNLDVSPDWRVMAFTAAVTFLTALTFGTLPALSALQIKPDDALEDGRSRLDSPARGAGRFVNSLIAAEIALSMVLIVAAGLFVGTFERLLRAPLGFDRDRVLMVGVDTKRTSPVPAARPSQFERLADVVAGLPGVAHAAASSLPPVSGGVLTTSVALSDVPEGAQRTIVTAFNLVTPGWFGTYGMSLLSGRDFDRHDVKDAPQVVIVNDEFVHTLLPDLNAVGRTVTISVGPGGAVRLGARVIVGVVSNAVYGSVRSGMQPTIYVPLLQYDFPVPIPPGVSIAVRAESGPPAGLAHSVASALAAEDPDLGFVFRPLSEQVSESMAQERLVALLAGFFGALALLLAALGLYGVTSYAVNRRRIEIGIRMALGVSPNGVVRLVLSRVAIVVGLGLAIGAGVSWWVATFARSLLFGLAPRDPATLVGAAAVLASVALVAGWLPARRASRIDPAEALRES